MYVDADCADASLTNSSFLCYLEAFARPYVAACVSFSVISCRVWRRSGSGCPAAAVRAKEEAAHQRWTPPTVSQILPVLARIHCRGSVCQVKHLIYTELIKRSKAEAPPASACTLIFRFFEMIAWWCCGFSGTPCYVDSVGVVRMLNRSLGNTWTPVCNTRETCNSKSDHYWVVGVHENPQQLRWALSSTPPVLSLSTDVGFLVFGFLKKYVSLFFFDN